MEEVEFKTVSPLFEMERDGIKPFTTRLLDFDDKRTDGDKLFIRIVNPATGESFSREVVDVTSIDHTSPSWLNIHW